MTDNNERQYMTTRKTLVLALEFGFIIVLPLVIFGLLGKWLETRYNTKLFLYAGLILAIIASVAWLYRRIKVIFEEIKSKPDK
jgi:hypothetical protein